jgi:hypothetical protein
MSDNKEQLIVTYIEGTVRVPDDLWAIVKKYRQLQKVVETSGAVYAKSVDDDMNKLYDALEVLVK